MNVSVVHTLGSGISAGRHFWTLNFEYITNYFQDDCLKKGRRAMVLPVGSLTSSRIFSTSFGWHTQPTAVADTHVACTVKTNAHQVRLELETPLSHLPSGLEDSCLLRSCRHGSTDPKYTAVASVGTENSSLAIGRHEWKPNVLVPHLLQHSYPKTRHRNAPPAAPQP